MQIEEINNRYMVQNDFFPVLYVKTKAPELICSRVFLFFYRQSHLCYEKFFILMLRGTFKICMTAHSQRCEIMLFGIQQKFFRELSGVPHMHRDDKCKLHALVSVRRYVRPLLSGGTATQ